MVSDGFTPVLVGHERSIESGSEPGIGLPRSLSAVSSKSTAAIANIGTTTMIEKKRRSLPRKVMVYPSAGRSSTRAPDSTSARPALLQRSGSFAAAATGERHRRRRRGTKRAHAAPNLISAAVSTSLSPLVWRGVKRLLSSEALYALHVGYPGADPPVG